MPLSSSPRMAALRKHVCPGLLPLTIVTGILTESPRDVSFTVYWSTNVLCLTYCFVDCLRCGSCGSMTPDLPTGSVSGKNGWTWNQWQDERKSRNEATTSTVHRSVGDPERRHRGGPPIRDNTNIRDTRVGEPASERRSDSLQNVIDHYERLLSERNRQIERLNRDEPGLERLPSVLSSAIRWITNR